MQSPEKLIFDICNPDLRENVLIQLCKDMNRLKEMAPLLWDSIGTVAALIQEIISIYPYLSPPTLTEARSKRVCNALALLQCLANHKDTRKLFVKAHIPLYLHPFLNTTSSLRSFEFLRVNSLGVIAGLVKVDDTEVINYLLSTEMIPLCLHTMEMGSELSKKVATFVVQKILLNNEGLNSVCSTVQRFFAVTDVLGKMVAVLAEQPCNELLRQIIRCYINFSDNPSACDALKSCLPKMLRDGTFSNCIRDDPRAKKLLEHLLHNVHGARVSHGSGGY